MVNNFRTLKLATEFYHSVVALSAPLHLSDQLSRAASSIALNLNEGSGRSTIRDQQHFFSMALGSLRECEAILLLLSSDSSLMKKADVLAAHIFCLIRNCRGRQG